MISLRFFVSWLVFARYWVSNNIIYDEESIYFWRFLQFLAVYVLFFHTSVFVRGFSCYWFHFAIRSSFFCLFKYLQIVWVDTQTLFLLNFDDCSVVGAVAFLGKGFSFDYCFIWSSVVMFFYRNFLLLCCLIFLMKDIGWLFLLFSSPEDSLLQFCGHLLLIKCLHI